MTQNPGEKPEASHAEIALSPALLHALAMAAPSAGGKYAMYERQFFPSGVQQSINLDSKRSNIPPPLHTIPEKSVPPDVSYVINESYKLLEQQQQERHFQARSTFTVALSAIAVGVLLIIIGIFCAFFINLSIGTVTSASSLIIDAVGLLSFKFHKDANDRYDILSQELRNLTVASTSMHYITTYISDPKKRDTAISDLVKQLRTLSPYASRNPLL